MDWNKIVKITKTAFEPGKNPELIQPTNPQDIVTFEPQEELMTWTVEVPPFSIPKKVFRTVIVLSVLFGFFLLLAGDWLFLILVLTMAFFTNVIMSYGSKTLIYTIYSNGIRLNETFYPWNSFNYFFHYDGDSKMIVITTKELFPGRLYLYVKEDIKDSIDTTLLNYIPKNLTHPKDFYEVFLFKLKPYLNLSDDK